MGETGAAGVLTGAPFTYDPYGRPDAAHGFAGSRFRYTGQIMITPEVDLWHYKARAYDPDLGRFLQTDPVGYEEGLNLYAYVGNDPFNARDPTGMAAQDPPPGQRQRCPDEGCPEDRAEETVNNFLDALGSGSVAANTLDDTSGYARGLRVGVPLATIAVEGVGAHDDVTREGVPLDEALVDRGSRAVGATVGGAVGGTVGVTGCAGGGPLAAACGAAGTYVGSKVGEGAGSLIGPAYRWIKREAGELNREIITGFDDWVSGSAGGYRPHGTRR